MTTDTKYMREYRKRKKAVLRLYDNKRYHADKLNIKLRRKGIHPFPEVIEYISNHSGVCDICGRAENGQWESLNIDHCHKSGNFRGMLCSKCNKGIGLLRDDPEILRKAIIYLEHHRKLIPGETITE